MSSSSRHADALLFKSSRKAIGVCINQSHTHDAECFRHNFVLLSTKEVIKTSSLTKRLTMWKERLR